LQFESELARTVEIYSANGQLIHNFTSQALLEHVDISSMSQGVCFIKTQGDNKSLKKIIKY